MKKTLIILAIVALAPVMAAPAAEAGLFSVGASFNVGGLFFDLGFGGPRYSAHASHHVYRVAEPFHYRGYRCHLGCYRTGGYSYHHQNCPAVAYHFRSHRFNPYAAYPSYFAPRSYGHYGYHRSYGGSRYDRRHPSRYYRHDRRYDRHNYRHHDRRHHDYRRHDQRHDQRRFDDRRHDRERRHDRRYGDRRRGAASSRSHRN